MVKAVEAARFGVDLGEQLLVGQEEVEGQLPLQILLQQREVGRPDAPQLGVAVVLLVGLEGVEVTIRCTYMNRFTMS